MPLDSLAAAPGGLEPYRIAATSELMTVLRRLLDGSVPLHLNGPGGADYATTLWAIDAARGRLSFGADVDDPHLQALLEDGEAVAVGHLDQIKLQFEVQDLILVRSDGSSALGCRLPRELLRLQRRAAYRVHPMPYSPQVAHLRHPMMPEMALALRVIDVGITGCALFLPADVPPLQPGVRINGVCIELDADTRFHTSLRLQHVSSTGTASGVRLGCELLDTDSAALRALQRYIDQTQKQRRGISTSQSG